MSFCFNLSFRCFDCFPRERALQCPELKTRILCQLRGGCWQKQKQKKRTRKQQFSWELLVRMEKWGTNGSRLISTSYNNQRNQRARWEEVDRLVYQIDLSFLDKLMPLSKMFNLYAATEKSKVVFCRKTFLPFSQENLLVHKEQCPLCQNLKRNGRLSLLTISSVQKCRVIWQLVAMMYM